MMATAPSFFGSKVRLLSVSHSADARLLIHVSVERETEVQNFGTFGRPWVGVHRRNALWNESLWFPSRVTDLAFLAC